MGTWENEPSIGSLLDEIGMNFALHTHHPLTHLEINGALHD